MRKKRAESKSSVNLVAIVEEAICLAIGEIPQLQKLSEAEYCETVLAVLDLIQTGLKMRLSELN